MNKPKRIAPEQTGLGDALFGTRLGEARRDTSPTSGADLFIVDNNDADWKVMAYLQEWA